MSNCLEHYAYDFVIGAVQPFSVREASSDRRLACFMLAREGALARWAVMQVAGPSNGKPLAAAITAAALACERCNQVDAEARRARAMQARARVGMAENASYEAAMSKDSGATR